MKKVVLAVILVAACCAGFVGCIKDTPYVTTINPTMTADIGTYKFVSSAVTPATIDTQVTDTSTTLIITGYSSDRVAPYDKIILTISNFKSAAGTFSIVQGEASALYIHGGTTSVAVGGIVSVTTVSNTQVTGYFSFKTNDDLSIANGKYTVGNPL